MSNRVVFTVGNSLMGDDGAGPLLAELLERYPAPGWEVVDGGNTPENVTYAVRAMKPRHVLLVDAADMGLPVGSIRRIDEQQVFQQFLITTHALPLNFLINSLREDIGEITFIGIQPGRIEFLGPISTKVRNAVEELHNALMSNHNPAHWPMAGE